MDNMPEADVLPVCVVMPALNAAESLTGTLAAMEGRLQAVIVADGGSTDATVAVAERQGADVVQAERGRGLQLAAGGEAALRSGSPWLLFLHADTRLQVGWSGAVRRHMAQPGSEGLAGYFRFRLDDASQAARRVERLVAWRCRRLALPYGDQGLLIHRALYRELGGFRPLPLMEDVDLVRRIGRARLRALDADALTSASRYRRDGYWRRPGRNLALLSLYFLGVAPERLVRWYG